MKTSTQKTSTDCACSGCGREMHAYAFGRWGVCWDCTKARHRAAVKGRCCCRGKRAKRCEHLGRVWLSCEKCLGTIIVKSGVN